MTFVQCLRRAADRLSCQMHLRSIALSGLLLLLPSFIFVVSVEADTVERNSVSIFDSIMSPYCPGRTLSACPSDDARLLRDEIVRSLEFGSTVDEEKQRLVRRFGPSVLGRPTGAAKYWSWGVPLAFLIGGGGLIVWIARNRRSLRTGTSAPVASELPEAQDIHDEVRRKLEGR